ncbi:MAG: hypothetical protein ACJA1A_002409 [Saprospiraceae bacterium]|jgi:hypothetical protein
MNQFVFKSTAKTFLISFMILGVLCMGLTWMSDDTLHTRFWTNLLHNSVFFTGISLMATFFIAVCITAYAGWHTQFKRVWEAFGSFIYVGIGLMLFIGIATYLHMNHLYHWADEADVATDAVLSGKAGFLNKNWYLFGTIIIGGTWAFFYNRLRALSKAEDEDGAGVNFAMHRRMRVYAAAFLPIVGFTSAAMVWLWIMSLDAHWYSTMFAWYSAASWFVTMIAFTILILLYLKANGYYDNVSQEHIHDIGKFLFAFSIFWTYLWFSQFMLIWYANIGEETIYFRERYDKYPILFFGNLIINFLIPFFVLLRNDTKRKFGSVGFVAGVVIIGHWLDFFLMIKPGALHTAHSAMGHGDHGHVEAGHGAEDAAHGVSDAVAHGAHGASEFVAGFTLPGFLEIGTFLGFLALFLFVTFNSLSKASLVPKNDPYLGESLHHHV